MRALMKTWEAWQQPLDAEGGWLPVEGGRLWLVLPGPAGGLVMVMWAGLAVGGCGLLS